MSGSPGQMTRREPAAMSLCGRFETSRDVRSKVAVTGEPALLPTTDFGGDGPNRDVSEHL